MSKLRKSIFIFGLVILCLGIALVTFLSLSATGLIASDPVEITLSVDAVTARYDAKPHKASEFTVAKGELLKGHEVQVLEYIGSQTEVGRAESSMTVRIIDEKGRDVSGEYAVTIAGGSIDVTKRNITVNQSDITAVYSGKPVINDIFSVAEEDGLCEGHRLVPSPLDEGTVKPTGAVPSVTEYAPLVYDAAGNNVTANYNIEFNAGGTTVNRRPIAITPVSIERTYDGTPLRASAYYIASGTLAEGHRIDYVTFNEETTAEGAVPRAAITDAESMTVRVDVVRIVDDKNNDVSNCYAVTKNTGTLTITPKLLTVAGKSGIWKNDQITDEDGNLLEGFADSSGLAEGEELSVSYTAAIAEPGSVPNTFDVVITRGGEPVNAENYVISKTFGTLTMERRAIDVNLESPSIDYCAKKIKLVYGDATGKSDEKTQAVSIGTLPAGLNAEDIEIVAPEIKNAGEYTYTVRLTDTANAAKYYLNVTAGTVTVNKAALEIQAINNIIKTYDGKPASVTNLSETFVLNSEAVYVAAASVGFLRRDAGIEDAPVQGIVLRHKKSGEDVTGNYDLTYNGSRYFTVGVKINPCKITVTVKDFVVNSGWMGYVMWTASDLFNALNIDSRLLADGDRLALTDNISDDNAYSCVDVVPDGMGTGTITVSECFNIVGSDGMVSPNYEINSIAYGRVSYIGEA